MKNTYKCSICGKEHTTNSERIKCEYNCLQQEEIKEKQLKKEEEKKEVEKKINELNTQMQILDDNAHSLYREYMATIRKKQEIKNKLNELYYRNMPNSIFSIFY